MDWEKGDFVVLWTALFVVLYVQASLISWCNARYWMGWTKRGVGLGFLGWAGGWSGAKDGPYAWGLCYNQELAPDQLYCKENLLYPCVPGVGYQGRGAFPIYWFVPAMPSLFLAKVWKLMKIQCADFFGLTVWLHTQGCLSIVATWICGWRVLYVYESHGKSSWWGPNFVHHVAFPSFLNSKLLQVDRNLHSYASHHLQDNMHWQRQ
jgi:hypothetical protein